MHSGVYNHQLASQFYEDFPIWLYHGVVGTPRRPASWTPARTPAKTPLPGARSFAPSEYYSTPQQNPSLVFSTSSDSYAPYQEELEMEEQVLEPYRGPKFANPRLQEVAVLSWGTALNVNRTPEIVLAVMALILSSLLKNLSHHDFKAINWLPNFYILA